jgi:hypothetical protein
MNAGLQCLLGNSQLVKYFLEHRLKTGYSSAVLCGPHEAGRQDGDTPTSKFTSVKLPLFHTYIKFIIKIGIYFLKTSYRKVISVLKFKKNHFLNEYMNRF